MSDTGAAFEQMYATAQLAAEQYAEVATPWWSPDEAGFHFAAIARECSVDLREEQIRRAVCFGLVAMSGLENLDAANVLAAMSMVAQVARMMEGGDA